MLRALLINDPFIIVATAFFGTISLLTSLFDHTGRAQHNVARVWARWLLAGAGIRAKVEGLENIQPDGSYVFAANHLSYIDTPLAVSFIPAQFRFLAKQGLWKVPFIGYHLQRAGHIPVPRDARASLRTLTEASRVIRERGVSVLVFPEGGRSQGEMDAFKEGAAYIAIKAGVPIVPVGIIGTRDVLPMDGVLVRSREVTLRIGKPIPTEALTVQCRGELTTELRRRVAELVSR
ncbi:MAG TPA: lysophospholipid acyltransferase family protein [Bryobacteraceae bacterium]|nr:lysophospholipid acyltransferase family protein [Bryobacteraceae bacterium]